MESRRGDDVFLSMIVPTLGRKEELQKLLNSIEKAKMPCSYEIIIVDQNGDGQIDNICDMYQKKLNLYQHKVCFRGLSKAKNYGIHNASGQVICFPDDDAEFRIETVEKALHYLKEKHVDCVFGKCVDKETGEDSVKIFSQREKYLNLNNFEDACIEATMFAKKDIFSADDFDENMGVGTIFGSQEGYDLIYRLLKKGVRMYFAPDILFYHPQKVSGRNTDAEVRRAFFYSCGYGYLCRKHNFREKYVRRLLKLVCGIPVIAVFRRRELKYFRAQKMGIQLGYEILWN